MGFSPASKLLWLFLVIFPFALTGDTPEATLNDFVKAWNDRNPALAAKYVQGGKPNEDYSALLSALPPSIKITLGEMKTSIDGDQATITVAVTAEATDQQTVQQTETVKFVKVDGNWLIAPPRLENPGQQILPSLAQILTSPNDVFANAKKAAKKTSCLSNVKQLALAVHMFLSDHDDKFKFDASRVKATLFPYTKNDALWYCPSGSKGVVAYSLNSNLIGKNLSQIKDPANTVMIYEGSKGKLDFRHEGAASVAFADGHAKTIKQDAAKKLNWKP